jgi:GT2 family glycosyltransferase
MTEESPLVSIVVVNWNGKQFLDDCLTSLLSQTYQNYEIILVDNGSTDGSPDYVLNNFPSVKIVRNTGNEGFGRACNKGIRYSKGEYIVTLNNDLQLDECWLEELIKPVQNEKVAATVAKALFFDCRDRINCAGGAVNFLGFPFPKHFNENIDVDLNHETTEFVQGGLCCIKRKVLDEVGLFDEDFFMYLEDIDLSFRIRMAGYELGLATKSIAYHKWDFKRMGDKLYHMEKNRVRFLIKNYSLKTLLLVSPAFFITEIGVLLYSLKGGWFFKKIRTYLEILKSIPNLSCQRREVQKRRKLQDSKVMENFAGAITYQEIDNPLLDKILNPALDLYWKNIKRRL